MPYLVAAGLPTSPAGTRFKELLERLGILQMPGTYNGMTALLGALGGFGHYFFARALT